MSESIVVTRRINTQEYIDNVRETLSEVKAQSMYNGDIKREPTAHQKWWMAGVMYAVGFYHLQWMKFLQSSEEQKIDKIREEEDGDKRHNIIPDILKRLFTRQSARKKKLLFAVRVSGGCKKAFPSRLGLARHIFDEYGEQWYCHVKTINDDGEPLPFQKDKRPPSIAPDL